VYQQLAEVRRAAVVAFRLHYTTTQEDTNCMWNLIKRIFFFRVGQNASRGMARAVGLGRFGLLIGLLGGLRYMRRHS
jgi:hypothetical protein